MLKGKWHVNCSICHWLWLWICGYKCTEKVVAVAVHITLHCTNYSTYNTCICFEYEFSDIKIFNVNLTWNVNYLIEIKLFRLKIKKYFKFNTNAKKKNKKITLYSYCMKSLSRTLSSLHSLLSKVKILITCSETKTIYLLLRNCVHHSFKKIVGTIILFLQLSVIA